MTSVILVIVFWIYRKLEIERIKLEEINNYLKDISFKLRISIPITQNAVKEINGVLKRLENEYLVIQQKNQTIPITYENVKFLSWKV